MHTMARMLSWSLVLIALAHALESYVHQEKLGRREATAEIASLDFLSVQVRRMLANVLWVRVDDYMHSSDTVRYKGGGDAAEAGVSAHLAAPEIHALARLVTMLDPSFVRAGVALGNLRMRDASARRAADDFVRGMIRANPEHPRLYALYATLGTAHFQQNDFAGALPYLQRAHDLYPRVRDKERLALLGDGPEDDTDQFLYRGILARLVQTLVSLHDYEHAVKYWAQSEGWDPRNKSVQILMHYRRMQSEGKVDLAELKATYERLTAEEKAQALATGKANSGDAVDELLEHGAASRFEVKPQELKILDLGFPRELAFKLGAVVSLFLLGSVYGLASGWLRR